MLSTGRTILVSALVSCVVSVTATAAVLTALGPQPGIAQMGLVRAEAFQLVGRDGEVLATLGELPNHAVGLAFWDRTARLHASFGVDADGSSGVVLNDGRTTERVALTVPLSGGGAGLTVNDARGEPRAVLSVESSGPYLGLLNDAGVIVLVAGIQPDGSAFVDHPGTSAAQIWSSGQVTVVAKLSDPAPPDRAGLDIAPPDAVMPGPDSSDPLDAECDVDVAVDPEAERELDAAESEAGDPLEAEAAEPEADPESGADPAEPSTGVDITRAPAGFTRTRLRAAPSLSAMSLRDLPTRSS